MLESGEYVMKNVTLEDVCKHSAEITWLLNNDSQLRLWLCSHYANSISEQDFFADIKKWLQKQNTDTYAIALDKKAIETISLSHQDIVQRTAQIGYWIGSKYWNKGYATEAFRNILLSAKQKRFEYVFSTIDKNNIASRLWEKHHAICTPMNDTYRMVINVTNAKL